MKNFLNLYSAAYRIPTAVFSGKDIICRSSHTVQDYNLPLYIIASLPSCLPPLWYASSPEQLYFGGISLPDSPEIQLLVGPVISRPCTRKQAAELISRLGRKESDILTLMRGLDSYQKTDIGQVKAMLSLLSFSFYHDFFRKAELLSFTWSNLFPSVGTSFHDSLIEVSDTSDIENQLLSCIQFGKVYEIEQILNEKVFDIAPQTNYDISELETQRSYIIGANLLASRTSHAAGLPIQTSNELVDYYVDLLMAAKDIHELGHLFYRLMVDYATQVQKMNLATFATPFASKVHRYIYAHIYEKLSTKDIAHALHLNENYLCKKFKEETNKTITIHIQECKITEAKYLLSTGRFSASEISDLLCFSSQSYFTRVFHKYTGTTPSRLSDRKGG